MKSCGICLSLYDLFPSIHVDPDGRISLFLLLSNTPLCMCVCVCIYIPHIFLIHLSIDGHLDCFHILAITSNVAMNIGVHISFQTNVFIFWDKYPEVQLLGHTVVLLSAL